MDMGLIYIIALKDNKIFDLQKENKELAEGWKIAEALSMQVSDLQEQIKTLICAIYEHANEGTELMEIAEMIDAQD
jgi:hypothetical protein